jgi:glycosyltransferase involved in cell wall biosynthesis
MNILISVPWYRPGTVGGVGLSVRRAALELVRRGHGVSILKNGEEHRVRHVEDDGEVPIYSIFLRTPAVPGHFFRSLAAFGVYLLPTLGQLRRFFDRESIDVVVIYYPGLSHIYIRLMKLFWGTKYAVSTRGSDINIEAKEDWITSTVVRSVVVGADGFLPCSARMLEATREHCRGRIPERTEVIYTGIDTGWADNAGPSAFETERDYILTLAWATPVKGPDIVMRAFAQIADRFPDVDLVMVGGGPQESSLNDLRVELGMTDRIIRLGTVGHESLPPVFEKACFGVVPSRNEGFPKATLEFGWMKKAVVATRVGGIPEAVLDGETGLLVDSEDIEGMAEKMSYLLDHPDERDRMGAAARRLVEERFTAERTGEQLERYLRGLLDAR